MYYSLAISITHLCALYIKLFNIKVLSVFVFVNYKYIYNSNADIYI